MSYDFNYLEAFVLAGGKSSRMGRDKGLVSFRNKPMINHILSVLKCMDIPTQIIANSENYHHLGFQTHPDLIKEKGPMGGLLTAFHYSNAANILLLSCDMPFISVDVLSRLISQHGNKDITVAESGNRLIPLCGIYKVFLRDEIIQQIRKENLKMSDFIRKSDYKMIPMDELITGQVDAFTNINTPQDLIRN